MSKEDWETLQGTGHAKNFEVLSESDEGYTPPEAQVSTVSTEKDNSTPSAKSGKKEGDK